MRKTPCFDCGERRPGCTDGCERREKWINERDALRKRQRQEAAADEFIIRNAAKRKERNT